MTPQTAQPHSTMPVGVWLGASWILGRKIRTDRTYPHICCTTVTGGISGRQVVVTGRDCAACMARRASRHDTQDIPAPPVDTATLAAGSSD